MTMGEKYLVTGGAGFIGSATVRMLLSRGADVRILDNLSTGKKENVPEGARLIVGDVTQYRHCATAVENVDYVIHLAALASVERSIDDPIACHDANVTGTLNMLEAAATTDTVKRLVYASSSSIYGNNSELFPLTEDAKPDPLSPYAISKLAGEQYCQAFWRLYGFETVCLRLFNVYGPRHDPLSQYAAVIPRWIDAMLNQRAVTVYGDGWQSRDFTYMSDVAEANLLACHAEDGVGEVFNVSGGGSYTLLELMECLQEVIGIEPDVQYEPPRPGDVLHSYASLDAAMQHLRYEPQVELMAGLSHTVDWFRGEHD